MSRVKYDFYIRAILHALVPPASAEIKSKKSIGNCQISRIRRHRRIVRIEIVYVIVLARIVRTCTFKSAFYIYFEGILVIGNGTSLPVGDELV